MSKSPIIVNQKFVSKARNPISDDVKIGKDPLAFDQEQMRAAFDAGHALALEPEPWSNEPPNNSDLPDWAAEIIGTP